MARRRGGMPLYHNQRALTEMAGERIAEMVSWRGGDFEFAVVLWGRGPEGKTTTYASTNDAVLSTKLASLIGEHDDAK